MLRNPAAVFERADEMAAQFRALMKEAEAAAREGEGVSFARCPSRMLRAEPRVLPLYSSRLPLLALPRP